MKELVIYGAGGHAKSVIDSIDFNKYCIKCFIDNFKKGMFCGKEIYNETFLNADDANKYVYFIAIGDNKKRDEIYKNLKYKGLELISIIDNTAVISKTAKIGKGCYVGKQAIINADAVVGDNTIINTRALVEHECKVGKSCHISTNTVLNGNTIVGDLVFVGSSSVVIGQIDIGDNTIVGAGAVVVNDLNKDSVYVGVPAKKIKDNRE